MFTCLCRLFLLVGMVAPLMASEPDPNFHLYLLVGQSNMAGRGKVDEESRKSEPRVLMLDKELKWVPAVDPLHFDKPSAGVGPGLAFGKRMASESPPEVRIGLIPCAVGGTSIKLWMPGGKPYDDMLVRARAAMRAGALKGIIWHQGEANRGEAQTYGASLTVVVARMRQDLDAPQVPFVAGELVGYQPETIESSKAFNAALNAIQPPIAYFAVVSAEGLTHKGDNLHFNTVSARILGTRYAEAILRLQSTH